MCGIAGIIGKPELTKSTLEEMLAVIRHRGPDDQGELFENQFAFGMRRLSIIDLGGGHQPIWNEDKTIAIVFNGEIYNHLELRKDLIEKGHVFSTQSDTEAIIHLYEEYVQKPTGHNINSRNENLGVMLNKLRGMFAFSIFDSTYGEKGSLICARDYFGIKPFYYRIVGDTCVSFGSEIKSLLKDRRYVKEINHKAVHNYLSFQYNPLEETFFKSIYTLNPGHHLTIDLSNQTYSIGKYWQYAFVDQKNDSVSTEQDWADIIRNTLQDSVSHHLISDVPVGAFLSGGIDSAITVTLMQKERERQGADKVNTFTIGFDEVSEHETAREVSESLGTNHHEIKISFDEYFKELPQIAWHFDEPVADPSAVALYFLAKEARKHVKVVLSGEGSDELFGGYNIYREPFALRPITILPSWIIAMCIKPFTKIPFNFFGKNYLRRAITAFNDRYIGNAYIFKPGEVSRLWKQELPSVIRDEITGAHIKPGIKLEDILGKEGFSKQTESRRMQLVDIHYWMRGDILAKADKMTMANSLELRVPYLDREVARISTSIPEHLKYKDGMTKYILRKAFSPILPKTTANRKKLGFPTPVKHWLKSNPDSIMQIIRNNKYISQNFNIDYINTLLNDHLSGRTDNARKIYTLLMFALWYNQFIQ